MKSSPPKNSNPHREHPSSGSASSGSPRALDHLVLVGRRLRLQGIGLALGIPSGIVAARFLGPTHRGELAVFVAGSFLLSSLLGGCSHESLPFLIRERRDPAKAVGTAVVIQIALGLVAATISFIAPALGLLPEATARVLGTLQPYFGAACVAYAMNHAISYGVLARSGASAYLIVEVARQGGYLVFLSVFVAGLSLGLQGAVTAFLLALVVQLSTAALLLRGTTRGLTWDRGLAVAEIRYGWRALPGRIADYFFTGGGDALIMSVAAGASGVGYYVVARSLTNLTLAPAVSTGLMVQATEKNAAGEIVRTRDLALAAAAFTLAGATLLAVVGPRLIVFVFGADFAASGLLLRLTLLAVPALLMIRVFSAWNARSGVPERTSMSVGITAIIFAAAAIPAGRAFGTAGAVVVFVMAAWLQAAMLWTLHRRGLRA